MNVTSKPPRQNPGAREVIGILDAADASRFLLPTASLQNTGGAFVRPTNASLIVGGRPRRRERRRSHPAAWTWPPRTRASTR